MTAIYLYIKSSIGKKQIVAATGLVLILFLIGHLAGNLFIYFGPDAYNNYSKKLVSLRPGLFIVEYTLLILFVIHIFVTALLVWENIKARPIPYRLYKSSEQRSLSTKLMPYAGTIILTFVIWHLLDFTFIDHHGSRSLLLDGKSYGLYGVVTNSFSNPVHCALYVLAMMSIGFHLTHAVQSFFQTFGVDHPFYTPVIKKISNAFGLVVAFGYSSIPIYIFFYK